MKTIEISNGEIRKGYKFSEMACDIQNKILWDLAQFEVDVMDSDSPYFEAAVMMDKMQTPWFLAEAIRFDHERGLIETIEANEFLYDETGNILPITYYVNEFDEVYKTTFSVGLKEYDCIIN